MELDPENKYWLYVGQDDHLIQQWAYYQNFNDATSFETME
jgi:hypothetical protein